MSDEPSLKELLKRAWHIHVEATNVRIEMARAIAESLWRNLRLILSIAKNRRWRGDGPTP
ncbi:MAG TPA: hypothetical protein VHX68_13705 [Planctomycetaceae bacterium]|jgi:hypothetical protein|nr:hypothetical protein [Planctomycetaceae bacterium]